MPPTKRVLIAGQSWTMHAVTAYCGPHRAAAGLVAWRADAMPRQQMAEWAAGGRS